MTFWDGDVSVPKQYFVSLLLLSPKFSWGSVFLAAVVSLLSVLLVTATGNRLFLPVLQAFMHRKAVEHLSQLCYLNPNIPVSMQFIPIFFSDDSCCFLISCCVLCMFVGSVPRAECQAAIWPCPKWAEQDLLKALFPGTHLPRCCCFALVQCHWFCWQCTLIPHWAVFAELVALHHTTGELLISTWTTCLALVLKLNFMAESFPAPAPSKELCSIL